MRAPSLWNHPDWAAVLQLCDHDPDFIHHRDDWFNIDQKSRNWESWGEGVGEFSCSHCVRSGLPVSHPESLTLKQTAPEGQSPHTAENNLVGGSASAGSSICSGPAQGEPAILLPSLLHPMRHPFIVLGLLCLSSGCLLATLLLGKILGRKGTPHAALAGCPLGWLPT